MTLQVVDSGEVQRVPQIAFKRSRAALYLDVSDSWLDSVRADDVARLARGEPIQGPPWVKCGAGIRYLRTDLEEWVRGERCGAMPEKAHRRGTK